jgi:hypothetical protein
MGQVCKCLDGSQKSDCVVMNLALGWVKVKVIARQAADLKS